MILVYNFTYMEASHIAWGTIGALIGVYFGWTLKRSHPKGKIDFLIDLNIVNNEKLSTIMATLAELNVKIDELQTSLDAEQAAVLAAIAELQATIDELNQNSDPVAIQAAIDRLEAVKADLEGTISNNEPPVEPPVE